MSWNRILPILAAIVLALPALVVVSPAAAAQDTVPIAPTIKWEDQVNLLQRVYVRFDDRLVTNQPDCTTRTLGFTAAQSSVDDPRATCPFTAAAAGQTQTAETLTFQTAAPLNRKVTLLGNTSLTYIHKGVIPEGVVVNVQVASGATVVASGRIAPTGDDELNRFTVPLTLTGNTGRVELQANQTLRLLLTASVVSDSSNPLNQPLPGQAPTWQIDDTGTALEIRAVDMVRAATWIADETNVVKTLFRPLGNETPKGPRVTGFFALQSALGTVDAEGPRDLSAQTPRFSIIKDGQPREIGPGGATVLAGVRNDTASVGASGTVVWNFPAGSVDYRGFPAGDYTLRVEADHFQGSPIVTGNVKPFQITSQSVRLTTYADSAPGGFSETQAHRVAPGGTTTYILVVNNTGATNDTFAINVTAPTAGTGFSAVVGGPDVENRRVALRPGEAKLVTVTVTAPFGAAQDAQAIHLVNATSILDPSGRSQDITLVTTVSNQVTREVGVIVPPRDFSIEPGVDTHFPVYVWNRGTRPANASLEVQEVAIEGWTSNLMQGNLAVKRVILSNIRPGDIAEATLRMNGPLSSGVTRHDVGLNATSLDASGISTTRVATFTLRAVTGVTIQVLDAIGETGHVVEVSGAARTDPAESAFCNAPSRPVGDCLDDGIDGTWFRLWVSNTGKITDTFELSADSYDWAFVRNDCEDEAFLPRQMDQNFSFYFRSPSGTPTRVTEVRDLAPGKTAEVYVWRPADRNVDLCEDRTTGDDYFRFVLQAKGRQTGALARAGVTAVAKDENGVETVLLEAVSRLPGYSAAAPLVDASQASKRSIVGAVEVGQNVTYHVRVTNAASWATFTDANGVVHKSDVNVRIAGVDKDRGWNVSIRPVLNPDVNDLLRNPYSDQFNLSNQFGNRREGWRDMELEVVVQAPSAANGTALAGDQDQFTIQASINGSSDFSTLEIKTVISEFANVTLATDTPTILAHAGEPGAYLLYVSNNGSSPASVTLRAGMISAETDNAIGWRVDPAAQAFPLAAFKNRTIALQVTPPPGAPIGARGVVNVTIEYAPNPADLSRTVNRTARLVTDVAGPSTVELSAAQSDVTIGPGGFANFTMTLRNTGSLTVPYKLTATPIPNWNTTLSPDTGTLAPNEARTVVLVLKAPVDVLNDTRFATIVRVEEQQAANNFDTVALTVNILGGKAIPQLSVPKIQKTVDRGNFQSFEVLVKNVGSAADRIPLEVRSADPAWIVGIQNQRGENITFVNLPPNELTTVNVTVQAPFVVPERTVTSVEISAFTQDLSQSAKATLQAEIHDYGLTLSATPTRIEALPGIPSEFILRLKNTGNDNDTLNVSAILVDMPEWTVALSADAVRLEPNQEAEVRAVLKSPTSPLPTPRQYTFRFFAGTLGGAEVNVSRNDTTSIVVTIPNYRSLDVDRDGFAEIVVDQDKRPANGYEVFREIFNDGLQSSVVAASLLDGRTRFFLDVPPGGSVQDGIADVWFDPETVYAYQIRHTPDVNGDGTPDYLLDINRDAKIDQGYDTVTQRYWSVVEVKVYGDERVQYLVDTTADGRPDRYYDPEKRIVTRTQSAASVGADLVGLDTDDDEKVDKYYNVKTTGVSDAKVSNFADFAREQWYFFAGFFVLVLLTVALVVARRRRGD